MKSGASIVVPFVLVVLLGKFIPVLAVVLIIGGLAAIVQAAIREGKSL